MRIFRGEGGTRGRICRQQYAVSLGVIYGAVSSRWCNEDGMYRVERIHISSPPATRHRGRYGEEAHSRGVIVTTCTLRKTEAWPNEEARPTYSVPSRAQGRDAMGARGGEPRVDAAPGAPKLVRITCRCLGWDRHETNPKRAAATRQARRPRLFGNVRGQRG